MKINTWSKEMKKETKKMNNPLLLESGVRIPKGTYAAKVIHH